MYALMKKYKLRKLTVGTTWTYLQQHGRKPYLSAEGLQELISFIKNSSDGGMALSRSEIEEMVKIAIRKKINR